MTSLVVDHIANHSGVMGYRDLREIRLIAPRQLMRRALVAVDTGVAGRQRLVHHCRRNSGHFGSVGRFGDTHFRYYMTASALGGIVRCQFLPNFLGEFESVTFVLRWCVELACQVSPELPGRLNVLHQAGEKAWRDVAVRATGANAERICVMQTMRQLFGRLAHFVTGRTKRVA